MSSLECRVVLTKPRLVLGGRENGVRSTPPTSPGVTGQMEETWEGASIRLSPSHLMSSTPAVKTVGDAPEMGFDPTGCLPPQAYEDAPAISVCNRDSSTSEQMSVVEISDEEGVSPAAETQERRGSTASTESKRARGRRPGPNYNDPKVKAIREERTPAPTKLSRNLEELSDAECASYVEWLENKTVEYDPTKDYCDVSKLGLLAHQKAKVEEETRAFRAMSAPELVGAIQRLLVDANEARRIGSGHIHGVLSGRILVGISCALVGVGQLASRVPANEEIESLKKTVDVLVRINVNLRRRLEVLEGQPTMEEGRKRSRIQSSPEEAGGERDVGALKKRMARIASSSSSSPMEAEMTTGEAPKPQRTALERPGPTRADFLKSREIPPAQEALVFDDTAIWEAEAKKKGRKKKKKKNSGRGEMELFSTVPSPQPPLQWSIPLSLLDTGRGPRIEPSQERTEE